MINKGLYTSNTAEWATPASFFAELNREFGFTLDPCCTHENAKCARHFTKDDDGLSQNWGGRRCIAIHHTAARSKIGWRRHTRKARSRTPFASCCYQLAPIRDGSTNTFIIAPKYGSFPDGFISTNPSKAHRSRLWL